MEIKDVIKYLIENQSKLFEKTTNSKLGQANFMGQQTMLNTVIKVLSNLKEE